MTKKDYELIAGVFYKEALELDQVEHRDTLFLMGQRDELKTLAGLIASALQSDNPKFDKQRFLTACGIGTVHRVSNGKKLHDPHNILS